MYQKSNVNNTYSSSIPAMILEKVCLVAPNRCKNDCARTSDSMVPYSIHKPECTTAHPELTIVATSAADMKGAAGGKAGAAGAAVAMTSSPMVQDNELEERKDFRKFN